MTLYELIKMLTGAAHPSTRVYVEGPEGEIHEITFADRDTYNPKIVVIKYSSEVADE